MNKTETGPVKDVNLPSTSTSQSLQAEENVNICDLMDLLDFDDFSNEDIKDMDFSFEPSFESLFKCGEEESVVGNNQNVLSTENDLKKENTGLSTGSDLNKLNTELSADNELKKLNTKLSADSDLNKLSTELSTDKELKKLNIELSTDSDLNKLSTELSTDNELKKLNTELSTDSDLNKPSTELSTDKELKKLNTELSTDSDLNKLSAELSTDIDSKKLNAELSTNSFTPQSGKKRADSIMSEVQMDLLFVETEENKDHNLVMTESCLSGSMDMFTKWAETSSCSEDTAQDITENFKYGTIPLSNHSQELALASLYDESKQSGSTVAGQQLLNTHESPQTITMQTLDCSWNAVDLETVVTNDSVVHVCTGTADGETTISLQPVTVNGNFNLKTDNLTSPEISFSLLSHTEIPHSMKNVNNIMAENETGIMTAEVGTPAVIPFTTRELQDHSYFSVRNENTVSASPEKSFELLSQGKTSHSLTATEKRTDGMFAEVDIPALTPCTVKEILDHSYAQVKDKYALTDHLNVKINPSIITENSVPEMINMYDLNEPLSVTNRDLKVGIMNIALHDIHVAENVQVSSCDMESVPYSTEVKEATFRGLDSDTNYSPTTENMSSVMNNIASVSQLDFITNVGIEKSVTSVNQEMPVKLEELTAHIVTNGISGVAVKTMNTKANNELTSQSTDTAALDRDILETPPLATDVRHITVRRRSNTQIDCSQLPAVGSGIKQKKTGNRADLQKNKVCSQGRARFIGRQIKNDFKLDGLEYSSISSVKSQSNLKNYGRSNGAEVKKAVDSKKQFSPPQLVNIGEKSDMIIVKCKENMPSLDCSKLGKKVAASATYLKSQVSPTYLPHHQSSNSYQPLSSDFVAKVTLERNGNTATKTKQSERNEITALRPGICTHPVKNDIKLHDTKQTKSTGNGHNIDNVMSSLKSCIAFAHISEEKFAGFTFEEPFVRQKNMRTYPRKNRRQSKGEKNLK